MAKWQTQMDVAVGSALESEGIVSVTCRHGTFADWRMIEAMAMVKAVESMSLVDMSSIAQTNRDREDNGEPPPLHMRYWFPTLVQRLVVSVEKEPGGEMTLEDALGYANDLPDVLCRELAMLCLEAAGKLDDPA